ncbi:hypothetical protein KCU81_g5463, partial [Aureobasidium melanogenum]|uniref:Rad21/Rec8-like protein N-terminal domain-containing protein n=1 Tax=Aureobasidium melanogenum (strain CBS 110374) TaxID=1043003 RepID=A0A074WTD9_AURM1
MFYSHEVLTSRKHGVATVWLVATLGSKSTLKKVDRKEICAVNIPKACQTIVSPEAPMALRLQSNLLYGVTRVYGEQCNFVLKDAQLEQNKIRTLLRSLHAAPTELDGKHKAKPGQLVLADDPNFIPELAWDIDFDPSYDILGFTSGEGSSPRSSLLSPRTAASSGLGSEHMDPNLGLVINHSSSVGGDGFGLGLGGAGFGGSGHNRGYSRSLLGANEEGLLPELDLGLGLDFDVDGNIIDDNAAPAGGRAASIHTPAPVTRDGALPDSNADQNVVMYDDDSLPMYQDDVDMQDVRPFTPRTAAQQVDTDDPTAVRGEEEEAQSQTSSTTASAPAARVRVPKPLPQDQELELHNADLQAWDREYLDNQWMATQHKLQNKSLVLARKNANFWVLQNGIGGLGTAFQGAEDYMPEPLRMFSGHALLQALTGIQLTIAGTKHPRDVDKNDDDQERRVRSRSDDNEVGRAAESNDAVVFDTGFIDDTIHDTIEQGREAPTPLADRHSSAHALPWNHAAPPSRGSSHTGFVPPFPLYGPGAAGSSSSIASGGGFNIVSSHRGRLTVSASPLVGRGALPTTNVEDMNFMQSDDNAHFNDDFAVSDNAAENPTRPSQATDFDLFGPAAAVSTQVAGTSQFLSTALSTESLNFLAFVKAGIAEAQERQETTIEAIASVLDVEASEAKDEFVEFEDLLKPESNSKVVAAQGFLHVLTLVTRRLLSAEQEEAFGQIELRVL